MYWKLVNMMMYVKICHWHYGPQIVNSIFTSKFCTRYRFCCSIGYLYQNAYRTKVNSKGSTASYEDLIMSGVKIESVLEYVRYFYANGTVRQWPKTSVHTQLTGLFVEYAFCKSNQQILPLCLNHFHSTVREATVFRRYLIYHLWHTIMLPFRFESFQELSIGSASLIECYII